MRNEPDYHRLIDGAQEFAIVSMDEAGRIVSWSAGAERLFGFSEEEAIGEMASLIFTAEDTALGEYEREIGIAAREGRADDDRWHVRKDGSRFWASGVLTALRREPGTVDGFVKVVRDKTEERRLHESLRTSEEQFARLVLANPAALAVERRDTHAFVMVNDAFLKLTGVWRSDAMGRSGEALGIWAVPKQRTAALERVEADGLCDGVRLDLRAKSGEVHRCVCALGPTQINGTECMVMTFIGIE